MSRIGRVIAVLVALPLAWSPAVRAAAPLVVHRAEVKAATAGVPLAPCKDGAYKLAPTAWPGTFRWSFRAISTPKGAGRDAATAALRGAAGNITSGRNSCGLTDKIDATQRYLGRTTAPTNIKDDSSCGTPDGKSVVGFGQLDAADLGVTCWWSVNGDTVEADIKLNKAHWSFVTKVGPACVSSWSIEAVATHEFGHAFGLDHVGEKLHGGLTMSPLILPCQTGESTLGLGDVRALRARY